MNKELCSKLLDQAVELREKSTALLNTVKAMMAEESSEDEDKDEELDQDGEVEGDESDLDKQMDIGRRGEKRESLDKVSKKNRIAAILTRRSY